MDFSSMNSSSHLISWCNLSASTSSTSCGEELSSLTTPCEEPSPFVSIPATACFTQCPPLLLLRSVIPSLPSPHFPSFYRYLLQHFISTVSPETGVTLFLWSHLLHPSKPSPSPLSISDVGESAKDTEDMAHYSCYSEIMRILFYVPSFKKNLNVLFPFVF